MVLQIFWLIEGMTVVGLKKNNSEERSDNNQKGIILKIFFKIFSFWIRDQKAEGK